MVVVYGIREELVPRQALLSEAIHSSMQTVLGLPEDKRFHRFVPLDKDGYFYGSGRSSAYTVIEVRMMEGRTVATKKQLIYELFERISERVGLSKDDVEITILEQPAHCWGFRGVTGDDAQLNYAVEV